MFTQRQNDSEIGLDCGSSVPRPGAPPPPDALLVSSLSLAPHSMESGAPSKEEPMEVAIIQNVSTQNFSLKVATLQGGPSGSDALWLQPSPEEGDPGADHVPSSTVSVSQIILTDPAHPFSSSSGQKHYWPNKYPPKVQILSNITIPKGEADSNDFAGLLHANYLYSNDLQKSVGQPTTVGNQVKKTNLPNFTLGNPRAPPSNSRMTSKSNAATSAINTYTPDAPNRSLNKLNNVTNTKMLSNSAPTQKQQSHVLSRVVPGPKMSLQTSGRTTKASNSTLRFDQKMTPKGAGFGNVMPQKVQNAMPVKIIQQQNFSPGQKTDLKTIPAKPGGTQSNKNVAYGPVKSLSGKSWHPMQSFHADQKSNQKPGYTKNMSGMVNMQKMNSKGSHKLVLQQTSNTTNRMSSEYYPAPAETDTSVRYIHNYMGVDANQSSNMQSANQNLTAQILQSLSQPNSSSLQHGKMSVAGDAHYPKMTQQRKFIHGDPNTPSSVEDIVGREERPTLSEESLPYHYHTLEVVMLDHTYALSQPNSSAGAPATPAPAPPCPSTPPKTSPVNGTLPAQSPVASLSTMVSGVSNTSATQQLMEYNPVAPMEDDAGSVISSVDGDRANDRQGSDTETAPEGEEEGKTRCVCEFTHDDGYMICCDQCAEWQHVDCMGIDRQNIPDDYMCDRCQPRLMDRKRARAIQMRKREELRGLGSSASDSSCEQGRLPTAASPRKKPLIVTTYSNTVGGVSRTLPLPSLHPQTPAPISTTNTPPAPPTTKRGVRRPRRVETGRKGPKRKIPEKRMKRKNSDPAGFRNKYNSLPNSNQQLNQWNEIYETASTNHYSPELRAKVARYCSNKAPSHSSSMAAVLTAHHCTTVPHAGGKILIATKDMKENSPIIELRGKYMLSTQHRPQPQPQARAGSQRPGPFLFFYRLPKDSTQVCIDTRTYGNEARFVRRSCKPNAELQHCIIKGALHIYLVTINSVASNTEISIRHESSGNWQPCACGNPKHCKQSTAAHPIPNGLPLVETAGSARERRGRSRHSSSSSLFSPRPHDVSQEAIFNDVLMSPKSEKRRRSEPQPEQEIKEKMSPKQERNTITSPLPEQKTLATLETLEKDIKPVIETVEEVIKKEDEPEVPVKEEFIPKCEEPQVKVEKVESEDKVDSKMEEEESKVLDGSPGKYKPRAQASLVQSPESKPKDGSDKVVRTSSVTPRTRASLSTHSRETCTPSESADEKSDSQGDTKAQTMSLKDKKKMTREERKMEAIMKAFERMEKAQQKKLENRDRQSKRRESDPQQGEHQEPSTKTRPRRKGRTRTSSQCNLRSGRLNSVDSEGMSSADDADESTEMLSPLRASSPSPTHYAQRNLAETDLALEASFQRVKVGLSSACLFVEAAVGPLESTFKFPKTKKAIMNEWLSKSPEIDTPYFPNVTENNNRTHPFIDKQSFQGPKSIENLVRAASTMIGNLSGGVISADSSPEKNYGSEQSEPENLSAMQDSSSPSRSPLSFTQRNTKKTFNNQNKTPKKFRRNSKPTPSPVKRSLRSSSSVRLEGAELCEAGGMGGGGGGGLVAPEPPEPVVTPLRPQQHSAKKRWLRQAISEESDSPTAESPPNEMVTPLKKRRLARESLTLEQPAYNHSEDSPFNRLLSTPNKLSVDKKSIELLSEVKYPVIHEEVELPQTSSFSMDGNSNSQEETEAEHKAQEEETACKQPEEEREDDKCHYENNIDKCNYQPENMEIEECVENKVESIQMQDTCEAATSNIAEEEPSVTQEEQKPEAEAEGEGETKSEPPSNVHSAETSGNSSPLLDEMDDIQKKIHSFHTENIQILKIRNKKPPKEKRKKVNLNFDLCVLANQTIGVKLTSETVENNVDATADNTTEMETDHPEDKPSDRLQPQEQQEQPQQPQPCTEETQVSSDASVDSTSKTISSFHLASEVDYESEATIPDMNVIKNAINMTANLDGQLFSERSSHDETKMVQEILERVSQMDSHNSVLLCGVLGEAPGLTTPTKLFPCRAMDPRLHPPPVDKPKPVRRKLSISEYRKRHTQSRSVSVEEAGCTTSQGAEGGGSGSSSSNSQAPATPPSMSPSPSPPGTPPHLSHKHSLYRTMDVDLGGLSTTAAAQTQAQTSLLEKQRDKLNDRLRKEFGVSLQDDEETTSCSQTVVSSLPAGLGLLELCPAPPHPPDPPPPLLNR